MTSRRAWNHDHFFFLLSLIVRTLQMSAEALGTFHNTDFVVSSQQNWFEILNAIQKKKIDGRLLSENQAKYVCHSSE